MFALGVWGAEEAFSGPMKEQGRCPGRERSTRKGGADVGQAGSSIRLNIVRVKLEDSS